MPALRALLPALAALAFTIAAAQAQSPPDKALQGAWDGTGQVATAAMAKTGAFKLLIDPAGFYLQVFRGPQDFVVDWGAIYAERGEFWRKTTTGLEDRGGYASRGDGFAFTGTWSRFTLKPAASAEAAPLERVAALLRERPKRSVEDWTARGKAVAPLWQADAVLQDATVDQPQAGNTLGPQSSLTMRFRSATSDRLLVLRSTASGALDSFLLAP
jgi:hypothetical protein